MVAAFFVYDIAQITSTSLPFYFRLLGFDFSLWTFDIRHSTFDFIPIKKVELLPPFLPQIYHKLNLLMLW
jgi:hypothetical protein